MEIPPQLLNLFKAAQPNPLRPRMPVPKTGDLVTFRYIGQTRKKIRDPEPIVLVADFVGDLLRGVKLQEIQNEDILNLMGFNLNNFSWQNYKHLAYIPKAFRSYKRQGISDLKMFDMKFMQDIRHIIDITDVTEAEVIMRQIEQMTNQPTNQLKAEAGEV